MDSFIHAFTCSFNTKSILIAYYRPVKRFFLNLLFHRGTDDHLVHKLTCNLSRAGVCPEEKQDKVQDGEWREACCSGSRKASSHI